MTNPNEGTTITWDVDNIDFTMKVLRICSEFRNENKAIVMYRSDTMEDDDFVGLYLSDVEEFGDEQGFFEGVTEIELWLTGLTPEERKHIDTQLWIGDSPRVTLHSWGYSDDQV